eukprot:SAG11_NODE_11080_length_785_cov_1.027697_1_plen_135_part_10
MVQWFIGYIVIQGLLMVRNIQDFHSQISSMSCFTVLRQCCCLAGFYKRKWRWDSVSVRHQRSNMVLGGIFLFVLMFQPVAEGSGAVATTQAAAMTNATDEQSSLDMSHLAKLDIDPVLLQFIGNVVTELKEVKND